MNKQANPFPGTRVYEAGAGANDNDLVFDLVDIREFDTFLLMSTAGAMDVFVSLDGANYAVAALSLSDLGATSLDPVLVTAAGRVYGFRGRYHSIRVRQNGATAVANGAMILSRSAPLA